MTTKSIIMSYKSSFNCVEFSEYVSLYNIHFVKAVLNSVWLFLSNLCKILNNFLFGLFSSNKLKKWITFDQLWGNNYGQKSDPWQKVPKKTEHSLTIWSISSVQLSCPNIYCTVMFNLGSETKWQCGIHHQKKNHMGMHCISPVVCCHTTWWAKLKDVLKTCTLLRLQHVSQLYVWLCRE